MWWRPGHRLKKKNIMAITHLFLYQNASPSTSSIGSLPDPFIFCSDENPRPDAALIYFQMHFHRCFILEIPLFWSWKIPSSYQVNELTSFFLFFLSFLFLVFFFFFSLSKIIKKEKMRRTSKFTKKPPKQTKKKPQNKTLPLPVAAPSCRWSWHPLRILHSERKRNKTRLTV